VCHELVKRVSLGGEMCFIHVVKCISGGSEMYVMRR
jgi:hypothetical protein